MQNIIKFLLLISVITTLLTAQNLEKVSVQLQWLDQFQFAGYYLAKEKGFYKDIGLDVTIKKHNPDINVVDEVTSKRATFGIGRSSLLQDKSNGADIILLSAIFQSSPSIIIAREDSGIMSIEDFKGKKMMTLPDVSSDVSVLAMEYKNGITLSDIIVQKHSYDVNDLIQKHTDLMAAYISNEPYLMKQKGYGVKIFDPKDYGFDFYSDILFTSADEVKNHTQRVVNFKNATLKGWEYAFTHIDEAVEIILQKYNTQHKSKEALFYEAKELRKLAYYRTQNLGVIDQYKIQRTYDIYNVLHLLKNPIDLDTFVFHVDKNQIILTQKEKEYLKSHPIIKANNEANWPPFNYIENNQPKGFSVDYMKLLAKKLQVKVEFVSGYYWSKFLELLQTPNLDVVINIGKNEKRAETMNFTSVFYTVYNAIYVSKKNPNFHSLQDLSYKTIAITRGYYTQELLQKHYPMIRQILVKNQVEALKLLSLGKVDAVIGKKATLDYLIENYNIPNVFASDYVKDTRMVTKLRLGVSKEDIILRNLLEKAQNAVSDEEFKKLKSKWLGEEKNKFLDIGLTSKEKSYIKKKKVLNICVNKDRLPYEAVENGKFIGISADFIKLYTNKLSIPIKVIEAKNEIEILKFFNENKCDIKPILTNVEKMDLPYTITNPILRDSISLVTKIKQPFIQNLDSLVGRKLLVTKGFTPLLQYMKNAHPYLYIEEVNSRNSALNMVKSGDAFGFIDVSLVASHAIQKAYSTELKIVNSFKIFDIGLGVKQDNSILLNILNKAIKKTTQIEKNQILNRWVSTVVEKKVDYSYVWKITVIFLFILLSVMYFYNKQKKLKDKLALLNTTLEKRVQKEVQKNRLQYQQMLNQSRLAQMGEMISMIAHQWRQPLAAISATTSNLKFKIVVDDVNKDVFNKEIGLIEDYSLHLSKTIDDFRGFFKDGKEKELTTLEDIVLGTLKIAQPAVENKNIEIQTCFTCNKPLKVYPNEIKQVVLNLIKNAEDVLIEKNVKNPQIVIETLYENNQKILRVKDNGGGVPEEILEKIFDPYFSTKKEKDGTGLGLYMSKTIVQEHCDGSLHVNNDKHGAIFTIVFN